METHVRTPQDVFMLPQHLVVPPFQRPYVWEEDEQWVPLWQDIRRLAEMRITQPTATTGHFLGAVVVQAQDPVLGGLQASSIIDGQQRLTTLQLLMDATAAALESLDYDSLAGRLQDLTHNDARYLEGTGTRLKLRHTNRDGAAFEEVMDGEVPVDYDALAHAAGRVVRAHAYFAGAVTAWLKGDDEGAAAALRAEALTGVLTRGLQLVVINLTVNENSQEIFETLNARGTPLTAADLIRNFVFQRLAAEGADTRVHLDDWPFETEFWEQEVSVGRFPMQRSSLFFNQWLVATYGEEISPRSTFTRFKQYVEHAGRDRDLTVSDLLPIIKKQAELYESWVAAAADGDRQLNRVELSAYRMAASETEALKSLLIWLHEPARALPPDVIGVVVASVESWVVRRQLLGLGLGDIGRTVADLIRALGSTPPDRLAAGVDGYISRLNVTSTYWPGDEEIRRDVRKTQVFRRFKKARLRMLLEAIENAHRESTNQPQVPRRSYPIEHILPQKWQTHWPVQGLEEEAERAEHVHLLGNLTLLTKSLNSKVSNGPWSAKKTGLQDHDTLLLNSRLLSSAGAVWDEAAIEARTEALIDALLAIWPIPEGHDGVVVDPQAKSAGWIQVKHLVDAGLLDPGTELKSRPGAWGTRIAVVRADGLLEIDGKTFDSPSGAGRYVKGAVNNGWRFWGLADGRRLSDVRAAFKGEDPKNTPTSTDWSVLHTILETLPSGHWTTYESLADAVGTAVQALGDHVATCERCVNLHRVLPGDLEAVGAAGAPATADAAGLLRVEGALANGLPDPARELSSDALQALVDQ
jgi:hypothetical protein